MHRTYIFEQKNSQKKIFQVPTYLPYFFFGPLQETNNFFSRPYHNNGCDAHHILFIYISFPCINPPAHIPIQDLKLCLLILSPQTAWKFLGCFAPSAGFRWESTHCSMNINIPILPSGSASRYSQGLPWWSKALPLTAHCLTLLSMVLASRASGCLFGHPNP